MYAVCQLARAMPKPSKAHMGAAKQLLRYLARTTDFSIVYKRGGFELSAFSDANWGNNPDNGKSTSAYLVMLSKAPISFKSGIQSLTAMPTMEAELVASALTMKQAVFCSKMMTELGFGQQFGQVPLYIDITATLHVLRNQAFSSRTKYITLRCFYVRATRHPSRPSAASQLTLDTFGLSEPGRLSIQKPSPRSWMLALGKGASSDTTRTAPPFASTIQKPGKCAKAGM